MKLHVFPKRFLPIIVLVVVLASSLAFMPSVLAEPSCDNGECVFPPPSEKAVPFEDIYIENAVRSENEPRK